MLTLLLEQLRSSLARPDAAPGDQARDEVMAAAVLMLEIAGIDEHVSAEEQTLLEQVLERDWEIPAATVHTLLAEAKAQHNSAVGVQSFTRQLNEACDADQKYRVLLRLWQLAYSDAHLSALEEHQIRRIAELLYIPHGQFIRAKQEARDSAI